MILEDLFDSVREEKGAKRKTSEMPAGGWVFTVADKYKYTYVGISLIAIYLFVLYEYQSYYNGKPF